MYMYLARLLFYICLILILIKLVYILFAFYTLEYLMFYVDIFIDNHLLRMTWHFFIFYEKYLTITTTIFTFLFCSYPELHSVFLHSNKYMITFAIWWKGKISIGTTICRITFCRITNSLHLFTNIFNISGAIFDQVSKETRSAFSYEIMDMNSQTSAQRQMVGSRVKLDANSQKIQTNDSYALATTSKMIRYVACYYYLFQ